VSAPDQIIIMLTSAVDGVDHAVTDEEMGAGRASGTYVALCGARVPAASLTAPPAQSCPPCAVILRARATLGESGTPTWWRR